MVYESHCRCKYDLQRQQCKEFGSGIASFEVGISTHGKQPWSKEFMDLKKETLSMLDSKQTQVDTSLLKYATLFAGSGDGLGRTDVVKHSIKTGDARPIKQPPRGLPFHMKERRINC